MGKKLITTARWTIGLFALSAVIAIAGVITLVSGVAAPVGVGLIIAAASSGYNCPYYIWGHCNWNCNTK